MWTAKDAAAVLGGLKHKTPNAQIPIKYLVNTDKRTSMAGSVKDHAAQGKVSLVHEQNFGQWKTLDSGRVRTGGMESLIFPHLALRLQMAVQFWLCYGVGMTAWTSFECVLSAPALSTAVVT